MLVFDIETGPLSRDEVLAASKPFKTFVPLGPFDPASVKLGQFKDPKKIAEKIAACKEKHEKTVADQDEKYAEELAAYEEGLVSDAALHPTTGSVLIIGYRTPEEPLVSALPEPEMLVQFWEIFKECRSNGTHMVGFNIKGFDLPFIARRSWLHGVPVPEKIIERNRYWSDVFIDLMEVWNFGAKDFISLDLVNKFFGGPGKNGNGADFARLFNGTPEERQQAIEYASNDLEMAWLVAERMGVN